MCALIVDDEPGVVRMLQSMLLDLAGLRTVGTTDSAEAVELFRDHRPDLVLLDLHMPITGGIELMSQLRGLVDEGDFVPIVLLTADAEPSVRTEVLRAGADDFLTKPLDYAEVVLRSRNLLRGRSLHARLTEERQNLAARMRAIDERDHASAEWRKVASERIRGVLARDSIELVFQPIADLRDGKILGVEALARFMVEPSRTPDVWFSEAKEVGLAAELELQAIQLALDHCDEIPADLFLSLNVSPETLASGALEPLLDGVPGERLIFELTEHAPVADYGPLRRAVDSLRKRGVRIAVDDAGAGFASLQHILKLAPDMIKLDLALTRDIDDDPVRRALAAALVSFAGETGAEIVAEGIETAREQETLSNLGITIGQGFHLARPRPLPVPLSVGGIG
ncbi:MAG TPA: EAL domain-containing response regulator [Acidimicrobiales bacterium]|nr:EAL domain-containing response regulator [Acidimicrobiales bacterium]